MRAGPAVRAAMTAARQALADVESDPDHIAALEAAARMWAGLKELSGEASEMRCRLVVAIVDNDVMSRAQLAEHLGVSRVRISQLYRQGGGSS